MNNHEKVKHAISQLIEKQAIEMSLREAKTQMENKLFNAEKAVSVAETLRGWCIACEKEQASTDV